MKIRASYHGVNGEVELLTLNLTTRDDMWTTDPETAVEIIEAADIGGDLSVDVENDFQTVPFLLSGKRWEGPNGKIWSREDVARTWTVMAQDEETRRQVRNTVVLPLDGVSDNVRGCLRAQFEQGRDVAYEIVGGDTFDGWEKDKQDVERIYQALIDAL